jgi:NTP pyrophosphatase (non-canonical NTP hydrolase)
MSTEVELYRKAIDLWGIDSQFSMLLEECCELIHAIHRERRGKDTTEHVAEEMADVSICIEQLKTQFPESFARIRQEKLNRLERLIAAHSGEKL